MRNVTIVLFIVFAVIVTVPFLIFFGSLAAAFLYIIGAAFVSMLH
jgi:hypothetical protein